MIEKLFHLSCLNTTQANYKTLNTTYVNKLDLQTPIKLRTTSKSFWYNTDPKFIFDIFATLTHGTYRSIVGMEIDGNDQESPPTNTRAMHMFFIRMSSESSVPQFNSPDKIYDYILVQELTHIYQSIYTKHIRCLYCTECR